MQDTKPPTTVPTAERQIHDVVLPALRDALARASAAEALQDPATAAGWLHRASMHAGDVARLAEQAAAELAKCPRCEGRGSYRVPNTPAEVAAGHVCPVFRVCPCGGRSPRSVQE